MVCLEASSTPSFQFNAGDGMISGELRPRRSLTSILSFTHVVYHTTRPLSDVVGLVFVVHHHWLIVVCVFAFQARPTRSLGSIYPS